MAENRVDQEHSRRGLELSNHRQTKYSEKPLRTTQLFLMVFFAEKNDYES